jgi:hypothetical protein
MFTWFDPPREATLCADNPFRNLHVTSINDNGVIIGWCFVGSPGTTIGGFERFPAMSGFW